MKLILYIILIILLNYILNYSNIIKNINKDIEEKIILLIFTILSLIRLIGNKDYYNIIKKDFQSPEFIIYFIIIISLIINSYIKKNKNKNNEEYNKKFSSYKEAFIALLIAYCSKLDLIFIPFFIIYIFNYYYE